MSKRTITRGFHIDGITYYFNFKEFHKAFRNFSMQDDLKGTSLSKCEEALSKILGASKDTVHGWRIEKNGPIDLDKIKELATALGLKNYMDLLYTNEHKEDITPMEITVTERQLDSLKKIYDAFLLFFDEYERTEGFNDYYPDLSKITDENKRKEAEFDFYKELHEKMYKVALVYRQELVVLHQLDIEELEDLIYEDLPDLYVNQLGPEERGDAKVREDHTWTEVPWDVAKDYIMDKLNEFMFQYF